MMCWCVFYEHDSWPMKNIHACSHNGIIIDMTRKIPHEHECHLHIYVYMKKGNRNGEQIFIWFMPCVVVQYGLHDWPWFEFIAVRRSREIRNPSWKVIIDSLNKCHQFRQRAASADFMFACVRVSHSWQQNRSFWLSYRKCMSYWKSFHLNLLKARKRCTMCMRVDEINRWQYDSDLPENPLAHIHAQRRT